MDDCDARILYSKEVITALLCCQEVFCRLLTPALFFAPNVQFVICKKSEKMHSFHICVKAFFPIAELNHWLSGSYNQGSLLHELTI
jgi:hypothetical protein